MPTYDSITAINIAHKSFDRRHNGKSFQTKDLSMMLSDYLVFNGQLYLQYDGEYDVRTPHATPQHEFSGVVNIYATIEDHISESWIEYDLTFEAGMLTDVIAHPPRMTKDKRDLSLYRPAVPSNRPMVSITINDLSFEQQDVFVKDIGEKVEAIRNIIGYDATISYPYKASASQGVSAILPANGIRYLFSVVQRISDIKAKPGKLMVQAPSGDTIIVLDEFHKFSS